MTDPSLSEPLHVQAHNATHPVNHNTPYPFSGLSVLDNTVQRQHMNAFSQFVLFMIENKQPFSCKRTLKWSKLRNYWTVKHSGKQERRCRTCWISGSEGQKQQCVWIIILGALKVRIAKLCSVTMLLAGTFHLLLKIVWKSWLILLIFRIWLGVRHQNNLLKVQKRLWLWFKWG